jgi:hypothetical protein
MVAWVIVIDPGSDPPAPGTLSPASPRTASVGPDPRVATPEPVTS